MKRLSITVEDTGDPSPTWDATWLVRIDRRRVLVDVRMVPEGEYATARAGNVTVDGDTMREAVAIAISPHVDTATDRESPPATIRRAIRDLTRCLEIREAMRTAKLPRLRARRGAA